MHYTIYKVTNLVNEKIYIGKHQTLDLNDDYLGSGKILQRAIKKYGDDRFDKEIIYIFDNKEDMDDIEKEIVDEEFISRKDTYNLKIGGEGGWDFVNGEKGLNHGPNWHRTFSKKKYSEMGKAGAKSFRDRLKNDKEFKKRFGLKRSEIAKKLHKTDENFAFKNKKHTEESKRKIGEANSKHQSGSGNSQFGKIWIYSLEEKRSMKIDLSDLKKYLFEGWIRGRKIKF